MCTTQDQAEEWARVLVLSVLVTFGKRPMLKGPADTEEK